MNHLCQFCQKETVPVQLSPETSEIIWQDCINCSNQKIVVRYVFDNYDKQIEYICFGIFFQDMPYSIDVWPEYKHHYIQLVTRSPRLVIYHHINDNQYPYSCHNLQFQRKKVFSFYNIPNINPLTIKEKLKTYLIFL